MRRSCLLVLCWGLILLGCVQCTNEYFIESPIQTEIAGFSLEEAQAYFEEEASQPSAKKRLWEKSSKATLVPGDFIPEWESATGAERNGTSDCPCGSFHGPSGRHCGSGAHSPRRQRLRLCRIPRLSSRRLRVCETAERRSLMASDDLRGIF